MERDELLSCDWGTSFFRLRLVRRADAEVLDEVRTKEGVAYMARHRGRDARARAYARVLGRHVRTLTRRHDVNAATVPVVVSGMAGSTLGWRLLPYADVPFPVDGRRTARRNVTFPLSGKRRGLATLVGGLRDSADVMRGEEVELVGLFTRPAYRACADRCTVILPGTHSKHVVVRRRAVVSFRTYMTGELFDVLSAHSLLRHSVERVPTVSMTAGAARAFDAGVACAAERSLPEALFRVRTNALFKRFAPRANAQFLSGLLIGCEAADLARNGSTGPVIVCAPERTREAYRRALLAVGLESRLRLVEGSDVARLSVYGHLALSAGERTGASGQG